MGSESILLRTQAKIATVVLACVLALTGIAASIQAVRHRQEQQAVEAANNRVRFYRVISGEDPGGSPTVDNALAKELQGRLGSHDPNATLPEQISNFRGDSNAYGGITDAIGQDPFNESGLPCNECGPLDAAVQQKLLLIKQGRVDAVIAQEAIHVSTGYTLTPFGIGILAYGLLWAVGLSAFFFGYPAWRFYVSRRFDKKVRASWPDYASTIDEVDNVLDRIDARHSDNPKVLSLQRVRNTMMNELRSLTKDQSSNSVEDQVALAERHMEDLRYTLNARKEVVKELEST